MSGFVSLYSPTPIPAPATAAAVVSFEPTFITNTPLEEENAAAADDDDTGCLPSAPLSFWALFIFRLLFSVLILVHGFLCFTAASALDSLGPLWAAALVFPPLVAAAAGLMLGSDVAGHRLTSTLLSSTLANSAGPIDCGRSAARARRGLRRALLLGLVVAGAGAAAHGVLGAAVAEAAAEAKADVAVAAELATAASAAAAAAAAAATAASAAAAAAAAAATGTSDGTIARRVGHSEKSNFPADLSVLAVETALSASSLDLYTPYIASKGGDDALVWDNAGVGGWHDGKDGLSRKAVAEAGAEAAEAAEAVVAADRAAAAASAAAATAANAAAAAAAGDGPNGATGLGSVTVGSDLTVGGMTVGSASVRVGDKTKMLHTHDPSGLGPRGTLPPSSPSPSGIASTSSGGGAPAKGVGSKSKGGRNRRSNRRRSSSGSSRKSVHDEDDDDDDDDDDSDGHQGNDKRALAAAAAAPHAFLRTLAASLLSNLAADAAAVAAESAAVPADALFPLPATSGDNDGGEDGEDDDSSGRTGQVESARPRRTSPAPPPPSRPVGHLPPPASGFGGSDGGGLPVAAAAAALPQGWGVSAIVWAAPLAPLLAGAGVALFSAYVSVVAVRMRAATRVIGGELCTVAHARARVVDAEVIVWDLTTRIAYVVVITIPIMSMIITS